MHDDPCRSALHGSSASKSHEPSADRDESEIRAAWQRGALDDATRLTLRRYGAEVLGFLVGVHRNAADADDAYGMFMERLWTCMPQFRWRCSMRTWVYLLARNSSSDMRRAAARRRAQPITSSMNSQLAELVQKARTETLSILRTEKRTALEELCMALSAEDRELLILRLSRDMAWRDVALVLADEAELLPEHAMAQASARVRKRFQLLRSRLVALAYARGLL